MKKVTSIIILVVVQAVLLYQLKGNFKPGKEKELHSFQLTFSDNRVAQFTKDNFPDDLILYYFTPDCKLCFSEVSDLVSYAKEQNIALLFVTDSDLNEARSFLLELRHRGISDNDKHNLIANIKEEDVAPVFGQTAAPQCVLFGKGLEVKGVREGVITNRFLAKAFQ